jgi:hypothetical protein
MNSRLGPSLGVTLALFTMASPVWGQAHCPPTTRFNFESEAISKAPRGFVFAKTGEGRLGRWVVQSDPSAEDGAKVVAQVDADPTDYRYPVALVEGRTVKNGRISAQVKMMKGKVDQAAGLVFRYRDANNYYMARANALENNVRLYKVVGGKRIQIGGWDGEVSANDWHFLAVDAHGETIKVSWDRYPVIRVNDRTFGRPGLVGLWTKADSITRFDDLLVIKLD